MTKTAVKICGITRREDATDAVALGAQALGFVFYTASRRHIIPEVAAQIVRGIPPFVSAVGLFVDATVGEIAHVIDRVSLNLLQFHGEESPAFCRSFRLPYIKAVRVRPGVDLIQYAHAYGDARGLLLDAYVEGSRGGTGTRFDWRLIPTGLPLPVILSGGLNPENVGDAIRAVRPSAVDVSSGVEVEPGVKDDRKMAAFFQGVQHADV